MTIEQERLTPTQEDRHAAAPFANCLSDMQAIFDGEADGLPVVQAFMNHRLAALKSPPIGGEGDTLRDAVIAAYIQGASDVHANWQEDRDPDFTEAAHDYAASIAQPAEERGTPTTSGDVGKLCEQTATSMKGDGNDVSRTHPLIDRLVEVVRHSTECSGYGRGDEHCDCDAVAALEEAATLLTQMEARTVALEKALEPFALQAHHIVYMLRDQVCSEDDKVNVRVTIADCRALLNPTPIEER